MSYDVFLIESTETPGPTPVFEQMVREIVGREGGRFDENSEAVTFPDGGTFELFGSMFAMRGLTPDICAAIFRAAEATASFIVPANEDPIAYGVMGHSGSPPHDFLPVVELPDAVALTVALSEGYAAWRTFADRA